MRYREMKNVRKHVNSKSVTVKLLFRETKKIELEKCLDPQVKLSEIK